MSSIFAEKYLRNSTVLTRFFVVHTFEPDYAAVIAYNDYDLFFDMYGNISVRNPTDNTNVYVFNNPLQPNTIMSYLSLNQVDKNKRKDTFIFSPGLRWILYAEGNKYYLLYNFIHTKEFDAHYKANKGNAMSIFYDYCKVVKGVDPTCSCGPDNGDICLDRIVPGYVRQIQQTPDYATLKSQCQDVESGCLAVTGLTDSFLNSYYKDFPRKTGITMTICSTNISAGRDIKADQIKLEQACKTSLGSGEASPTNGSAPAGTAPAGTAPTGTAPATEATESTQESSGMSTAAKVGIGVGVALVVIMLIIAIWYFFIRKSNPTT